MKKTWYANKAFDFSYHRRLKYSVIILKKNEQMWYIHVDLYFTPKVDHANIYRNNPE